MTQVLFLLSGPPASGKTTLRNRMFPMATVICPDESIGYTKENPWRPKVANAAWKKADSDLKEALKRGDKLVVFDATFVGTKKRKKYIKIAKDHNALAMIVYCEAKLDTIIKRNAARSDSRKVPKFVMTQMVNNFQKPTREEGFEVVLSFNSETNEIEGTLLPDIKEELQINMEVE